MSISNGDFTLNQIMNEVSNLGESTWRDWDNDWDEGPWDKESWSDDWRDSH